jgi:hypothetical protein
LRAIEFIHALVLINKEITMNTARKILVATMATCILMPITANAEGFFVGGSIGSASLSQDFDGLTVDDSTTSFRLVAGWRFNEYFSVEGGYNSFGKFKDDVDIAGVPTSVSLTADGFTLGLGGSIPLSDRFSLIGRAGMFFWNGTAEINSVTQADPGDSNPFFGAGAQFAISSKFLINADFTRYEVEDANSDVLSVGFEYRFGG